MNNDLLTDYASKKTRFFNHVLDNLIFWVLFVIHGILFEDRIKSIMGQSAIKNIIYFLVLYFLYHFIFELLSGRTPGKFITGTKVIDEDEKKPNARTLLIRNLSRLIPFDALSYLTFEKGWHDSISKTSIINV